MTDGAVGRSAPRRDAEGKVTGAARYPADLQPDDVLHARVVFSGRPHARMVSMDTSAAEATPGVVAVFTAADVPVNEYGLTMFDQPVMVGLGGTATEVLGDIQVALGPVDEQEAERMLRRLRTAALFDEHRGRPALDVLAAARAVAALSRFAAEHPEIAELEVNPLLVTPDGAVALDARIVPHPSTNL